MTGLTHQYVEAVVIVGRGDQFAQALHRGFVGREQLQDEFAARAGGGFAGSPFAHIGQQRPSPVAADAEPGAAADEIASGENAAKRRLGAPRGRRGGARVQLVAVGGHHQRVERMGVKPDDCETHQTGAMNASTWRPVPSASALAPWRTTASANCRSNAAVLATCS